MSGRLGGWHRLGIVVSVFWVLLLCSYAAMELATAPNEVMLLTEMVVAKTGEPASEIRSNPLGHLVPTEPRLRLGRVLALAFVPVGLAWVIAYLSVWAVRWVLAGFREK